MTQTHVGIVNYGAGNVASLGNAFRHLRSPVRLVTSPEDLTGLTHLVLPGVGSFGFCADRLRSSGMQEHVIRWAMHDKRPLLGVCVGMQLLTQGSDETPGVAGLGWIPVTTRRLPDEDRTLRLPHVGWDDVDFSDGFALRSQQQQDFYFDHTFALLDSAPDLATATCDYAGGFLAAVRFANVVGAQFHPEKSQRAGLDFLQFFLDTA